MEKMTNFSGVYSEQFLNLVRMHLSLELDIKIEDNSPKIERRKLKRWSLPMSFSKRSSGSSTRPKTMVDSLWTQSDSKVFLTDDTIRRTRLLMDHLSQVDCINEEGIFRISGSIIRQKELKILLLQDQLIDLNCGVYNVHDCASVLKGFFAELPEPLLTERHYPIYCRIAELRNSNSSFTDSKLLDLLQLILMFLPSKNRIILENLFNLLTKIASLEATNKMSCENLAKVFAPHLMCPKTITPAEQLINLKNLTELVVFMIENGKKLFELPEKLVTNIGDKWNLLNPNENNNINETVLTDTAPTVSSFVYPQSIIIKASGSEMNKKVKKDQQDTPRQKNRKGIFRSNSSLGYIVKHIFQKKGKKSADMNIEDDMTKTKNSRTMGDGSSFEVLVDICHTKHDSRNMTTEKTPKITRAMQKILTIPRSRKAAAIAPSSNLSTLSSIEDDCLTTSSSASFSECLSVRSFSTASSSDLSFLTCSSDFYQPEELTSLSDDLLTSDFFINRVNNTTEIINNVNESRLFRKNGTSLQRSDSLISSRTMII